MVGDLLPPFQLGSLSVLPLCTRRARLLDDWALELL